VVPTRIDREYVEIYPVNWHDLDSSDVQAILSTRSHPALLGISIFIYVPFCPQICGFCQFYKTTYDEQAYRSYVEALSSELLLYKDHPDFEGREVTAIYIGGGTGSLLEPDDAARLLGEMRKAFPVNTNAEVCIESHPATLNDERIRLYRDIGVTRLSIGVQSFSAKNLEHIQRLGSAESNQAILDKAHEAGFEKVGIDMIYRFPHQSLAEVERDFQCAIDSKPHSISAYSLEVGGTALERLSSALPDDDTDHQMFNLIGRMLEDEGYTRFAQPDFAREGGECLYVVNAWRAPQQLMLGLGVGAHSHYFGGHVWSNTYRLDEYLNAHPYTFRGSVGVRASDTELMAKYMVLGVRCIEVPKSEFLDMFGVTIDDVYRCELAELENVGWIRNTDDSVTVTPEGLWFINNISKHFYSASNASHAQPRGKHLHEKRTIHLNRRRIL